MSTPVRARRLTEDGGRYLLRLVRRGVHDSIRYRRALIIMASASGTRVPPIARLIAADPDTDRIDEVMSRFPDPVLRVRPVRAAIDPALPRHLLGRA